MSTKQERTPVETRLALQSLTGINRLYLQLKANIENGKTPNPFVIRMLSLAYRCIYSANKMLWTHQ